MNLKYVLLWMTTAAAVGALLATIVRPGLIEVVIAWALISGIIVLVLKSRERRIKA